MTVGPDIANAATLLGEPARAAMIAALLGGETFPASVLAARAGVSAQTASVHLSKLAAGGLVASTRNGRHRLYRLGSHKIAEAVEALAAISAPHPVRSMHQSDEAKALDLARMCYDHLAGFIGVSVTEELVRCGVIARLESGYDVTRRGHSWLAKFGIDVASLSTTRRKVATTCLDWSERRPHVGGALGAALADRMLVAGWFNRRRTNRSLIVTEHGWASLKLRFKIDPGSETYNARFAGGRPVALRS
ncbi:MAG TPA: helix-turn-helix transcriptional regulator [Candidatus Eremiobacteraceae bacterium]